ncbi:hypothetical protein [Nitrosomonas sp. Nm33]|uniref:hypothetical protein n=1 Tax=Nitrosomonas sp. Nm33 TaxID=133724 RepID=UPI00089C2B57|nr:hypothetical protein [Nitrosomonas sp. Nm33]SDY92354.1 hypothetical protein SAMN05421755_106515 [Nitrosomonas sp. Nm33]
MRITTEVGTIELVNEPVYSFGSADNVRGYLFAKNLATQSIHGILLNGEPVAVLGCDGSGSVVHEHSAVYTNGFLYVAVGNCVVCIQLNPFAFKWSVQADTATCFGVYFEGRRRALISHGELEIARLSESGEVLWSASGADIFTEGISLLPECVEAVDFNGKKRCQKVSVIV